MEEFILVMVTLVSKKFTDSEEPLDIGCDCPTCQAGWTKKRLRELLKSENKEDKYLYFNLATAHNLRFIIRLTEEIHQAILEERFEEYKNKFLKDFLAIKKSFRGILRCF